MRRRGGTRRGMLVLAAAAALVVSVVAPGYAASPASGSVGPSGTSASWGGAFLAFSMITVAPALAPASAFSPTSGVGGVVLCGAACGSGDAGVWAWGVAGAAAVQPAADHPGAVSKQRARQTFASNRRSGRCDWEPVAAGRPRPMARWCG